MNLKRPSQLTNYLDEFPLLAIFAVYLVSTDAQIREILYNYALSGGWHAPTLDGNALRKMGIAPGPVYRNILGRLRNAWLDKEVHNVEEEKRLLQSILTELTQHKPGSE